LSFVFGKLAAWLVRPGNALIILALVGLIGQGRGGRRWARATLWLSLTSILMATLLPIGNWLIAPLEDRFPRPSAWPERVDGVVVLGGGGFPEIALPRGVAAFGETGERFMALIAMARRYPQAEIVYSGGIGRLVGNVATEAEVVRLLVAEQGLPADRVRYEERSRTTWENALYTARMIKPQPGQRWLLVTSAIHMPRSVGAFRKAGLELEPWPVDYRTTGPFELFWQPQVAVRLNDLDEAAYEWFGLLYYRLQGWSDALLPGPRPVP
jgi:uncharacterized SAM-binding protein YcdF (DUF218 family)